jgi:hypothetical protein
VALHLQGTARVGGVPVTRPVVPAEDLMQAFAYRHLVPTDEFLVEVTGKRRLAAAFAVAGATPLLLPAGGTAQVQVTSTARPWVQQQTQFELDSAPAGVTLGPVTPSAAGWTLTLQADAKAVKVGYADNLLVEAYTEVAARGKDGKPNGQKRRVEIGVLPAIPVQITAQ